MDPMTISTTYAALKKKYRDFRAPTARVLVEGVDIAENFGASIANLTVDLTCEYPASGCGFDLVGEYAPALTDFRQTGAVSLLELGASVEIKLGYILAETVFQGLLTELTYHFEEDAAPYIHVECMDAKCLLMKTRRLEVAREQTLTSAVTTLLSGQPVSRYLSSRKIASREKAPAPAIRATSDYDYLVQQARYTGSEFFILCGTAYFRPIPEAGRPVMELSPGGALLTASLSLRGVELTSQVRVLGVDHTGAGAISGAASASGRFGKGSAPAKMLDGTEQAYTDAAIETVSQAQERAQILMRGIQNQFGQLECRCIGLPELIPGRMVQIGGLSKRANGVFYIVQVRHTVNEDGFSTTIGARSSSL